MVRKLKVGDKVWGNIGRNEPYAIVKDLRYQERKVCLFNGKTHTTITDITLTFPNNPNDSYRTTQDKVYLADERVLDINFKSKWEVNSILGDVPNKVKMDNGYFGAYSLIDYKDKQAIVYVDDRDAKVKVTTDFYDKIFYNCGYETTWSGDNRWNSDKPLVVYKKRVGYNIIAKHSNRLLCNKWLKSIESRWYSDHTLGYYLKGKDKKGNEVIITENGSVRLASMSTPENINDIMTKVKNYTNDEVLHLWIEKGLPCAHIHGLEYKGAHWGMISQEKAKEMFKTHNSFGGSFNSAEWRVLDSQVTLLFRDYTNSDYD